VPADKPPRDPADDERSKDLDPRLLLTFREVARLGSISAAARKLGWTQPAIGQQLRRLEREAGTALVSRHARGVTLTPAGRLLLEHAEAIASRLVVAQAAMRDSVRGRAQRLQLATFATATAGLVAPALGRLVADDPDAMVRLLEMEPPQAVEALREGQVDAALVFEYRDGSGELDGLAQLRSLELGRDPLLAVLPGRHALGRGGPADAEPLPMRALSGERWVSGCLWCQDHLAACGAASGFRPDVRYVTEDQVALQEIVAAGLGVALVPRLALRTYRRDDVAVRAIAEDPIRTISLLTRPADPRPILSRLATQLGTTARVALA
jgi:DNA-binding transcriptional LysR family regulator